MLDGIPVLNLSAGGILAVVVFLVLTGRLITRRALLDLLAQSEARIADVREDLEARIADKDAAVVMWRSVAETSQAQMAELLEHSRLSVQLLTNIEARAKERGEANNRGA